MNQAYSLLTIKSIDEEKGIVYGIATTPATDRVDDVVEPQGAKFTLPIPFLWQHNDQKPVGNVIQADVKDDGIHVAIQMVLADQVKSAELKERLLLAWDSIKTGLVRGLSIRLRGLKVADIQHSWGLHFFEWEWLELSAVTIPANQEATITSVKSFFKAEDQQNKQTPIAEKSVPCVPPAAAQPESKHVVVKLAETSKSFGVKLV
ncbi:HK97 family phage prohead protease [Acinetobacter sp. ANC 4945]|uniref:Peptidase U35 n=1 Tax=Acinetobacter amyesii TaxID=2942470 RepID=A0A1T1H6P3_9GAMM|nr:HK97 family phage prohead protease [Acinetobacter amyesii]MCL6246512.1 HK97 family phage prohead protease [Acinetobacter amyesii]OOV85522.1 peptidase U35 [Acinetobacter amyesii]